MTRASDQTIDLGGMIEGIRRWVENESPTRSTAAVNRMLDLVTADLDGVPVTVDLATFGHLQIVGAPRSGRSQALRTFAAAAASASSVAVMPPGVARSWPAAQAWQVSKQTPSHGCCSTAARYSRWIGSFSEPAWKRYWVCQVAAPTR